MNSNVDLTVLMPSIPMGGVGKMRTHLVNEIARRGHRVDLVLADLASPYIELVDPTVRIVRIATSHAVNGVLGLGAYLWRTRPRTILAQRIRVNVLALRAHALVRSRARLFVTVNVNMSAKLAGHPPAKRARELADMRSHFSRNHGIIAVSRGVADDAARLIGIQPERIFVAPNPTVTTELYRLAEQPLDHPWFAPGEPAVILGIGRLMPQKDFPTLLRAFARLRVQRRCRLVILGEGRERARLQALAIELGIDPDVQFPGFVHNPYQYLARAGLFVLSSLFEGSPNALTEALAIGTPLVSTDCPDGPRDILEGGKFGPLVPVGDVEVLAAAMAHTLDHPPDRETLRASAQRYTVERSASAYIEALGLGAPAT